MRKVWLLLVLHKNLQNKEKYAKIKEKLCKGEEL